MPFSTLFSSIYTNSIRSLMKIAKLYFNVNRKKSKYLSAPKLKENASEYSLLEKIYNALFYSILDYIHQLSILSHVKYRNSNFT